MPVGVAAFDALPSVFPATAAFCSAKLAAACACAAILARLCSKVVSSCCETNLVLFRLEIKFCRPVSVLSLFDGDDDELFDAPSCGALAEESVGAFDDGAWLPDAPSPGRVTTPATADRAENAKVSTSVSDSGELPEADAAPDGAPLDPEFDEFEPLSCPKSDPFESAALDSLVKAPTVDANRSAVAVSGSVVVVILP